MKNRQRKFKLTRAETVGMTILVAVAIAVIGVVVYLRGTPVDEPFNNTQFNVPTATKGKSALSDTLSAKPEQKSKSKRQPKATSQPDGKGPSAGKKSPKQSPAKPAPQPVHRDFTEPVPDHIGADTRQP